MSVQKLMDQAVKFSVSDFVALANQTLEYAFQGILIEGEISSFKTSQGKYVFFDLRDESATVSCFIMLFQLRVALENGMKVIAKVAPKVTANGRLSLTVLGIWPSGHGSIKKNFDLLRAKLAQEGIFDKSNKRTLPDHISRIAVISSTESAGYADFIKVINERWGGLIADVAHVQVQGQSAADQIIRALRFLNQTPDYDAIAIIRGGGSTDDLSVFNDELLVREIAISKTLVITGIGHETDLTLVDLAADINMSNPTNVAQLLTPNSKDDIANSLISDISHIESLIVDKITTEQSSILESLKLLYNQITSQISNQLTNISRISDTISQLNPETVLKKGYCILKGEQTIGNVVEITTYKNIIQAEVKHVQANTKNNN